MIRTASVAMCALAMSSPALAEPQWTTVEGKIVFDDSQTKIPVRVFPPQARGVALPPCAARDKEFLTEDWIVDPKTKAVKNAVVWLAPEPTADDWKRLKSTGKDRLRDFPDFKPEDVHPDLRAIAKTAVELDQPCCRFIPHQLAVRVGQTLLIKNSAAIPHNAKFDSAENGAQNPLIPPGDKVAVPIKKPERYEIKISCSIHQWMHASVRVFNHPYFAVTNERGEYAIQNAPVGKYRIFVWHSAGGYSGGRDGRFGYELTTVPKLTRVKDYSVTRSAK